MRIIAGEFRGRRLKTPSDQSIRPTSDKVKEAVFSMIMPFISDRTVLMDVFSGTGNLGLEALSRGARRVYFSDVSRESLHLVKENIRMCGAEDRSVILSGDFRSNIARVSEKVDVYLLDPPYADGYVLPALDSILDSGKLSDDGIIVCEYEYRDRLPAEYGSLEAFKDKRYGKTGIMIYRKKQ